MYQNSIDRIKAIGDMIRDSVTKDIFPIETNDRILYIESSDKIKASDIYDSSFNIKKHLDAKLHGRDLTMPLKATLVLKNKKTGEIIDRKKVSLLDTPVMTNRGSFIYGGNDYHIVNQLRLKPGVYTRIKENGEVESFFNLSKGGTSGLSMWMDPESGKINFKVGGKNPSLYSVMKALDVSDKELESKWGKELFDLNKLNETQLAKDIAKTYESLYRSKAEPGASLDHMKSEIKRFFDGTGLSPETTKITLGREFDKITPDALLRTSDKLIKVSKKEDEPDERDSLVFKNIFSVEDLIGARISAKAREIKGKIKNNLNSKDNISDIYSKDMLNKPVRSFLTQSSLSTSSDQTNPVAMANAMTRTTLLGEGGISSLDIITTGMRAVSDSHLGALDPTQTPESKRIGVNLNLTKAAVVEDKEIKTPLINIKTGAEELKTKLETFDSYVAFPDQYDNVKKQFNFPEVRAVYKGKTVTTRPENIDFIMRDPSDMFSLGSNLIPFIADVQGNRTMLANKMSAQAISLKDREAPLVQVKRNDNARDYDGYKLDTEEKAVATVFAVKSPVDGIVTAITDDYAEIKPDSGGENIKVYKYNYFPMSNKAFINSQFNIKVGDKVKYGQVLCEDNFTKDRALALGTNLNIAYLPYKDKTFEDGIVISQSAAKKLTSQHMHTYKTTVGPDDKLGLNTYMQQVPNSTDSKQQAKLDANGVIKVGEIVEPGDLLVALLHYREPNETDVALGKLSKTLVTQYRDGGVRYDHDTLGKVERVVNSNGEISVYISTEKAAEEGDKLVGRYGNKGVITGILPDADMPVSETGVTADIIMSPYGVPGRINVGQIYETIAGKAALKKGGPIKITNMDPNIKSDQALENLAKEYGVKTSEKLYDPKTGRLMADTSFGPAYIYKLTHMVEKKLNSRGPYASYNSDEQPAKGGEGSARSMDRLTWNAMIAHGARENLREMATYKANKNPELWNKIRLGLPIPAPKSPFATDKLFSLMQAAGINVKKDGQLMQLAPMTDDEILAKSNGAIDDAQVMMAKTLRPIKDGLFDDAKTGGINGKQWTHIELSEPIVSPVMAQAAMTVLGLPGKKFDAINTGSLYINPDTLEESSEKQDGFLTGGLAMKNLLAKINPESELNNLKAQAKDLSGDKLDKINKKMRYLKTLVENKLTPDKAYIINNIPVLPPHMRPIYSLPDGSLSTTPINFLYRDLIMVNKELKSAENLPEFAKKKLREDLFAAAKSVQGLGNPIMVRGEKKVIGALETIKGDQPKEGYFQSVAFAKKQELSGQSTAAPSADISPDEVMLPKAMGWNLFEPFIHNELTRMGYTNMQAKQMIADKDPKAEIAMERVAENRPVWINRAPSLHKLSMLAMMPKLYDGSSIKVNPLVIGGYNLDFDGDSAITSVFAAVQVNKFKKLTSSYNFGIIDVDTFIDQRRAAMPSKDIIMLLESGEELIHLNLEDFPRIESTKEITPSGNINYKVPDGISIFTLDNETREFIKKQVTDFSIHPDLEVRIVTTAQHETLILSADHSAIVFDFDTGLLTKCKPDDIIGKAIPRSREMHAALSDDQAMIREILLKDFSNGAGHNKVRANAPLTGDFGHFIGLMVGDGWVSKDSRRSSNTDSFICIASIEPGIAKAFEAGVNSLCESDKKMCSVSSPHKYDGHDCYSEKHTISNSSLAGNISEWIGKGADNKHLPPWFLYTPEEFRLGLLAGLIDTDGSACWVKAKAKATEQFQLSYHTMSIRLAYEIITLARSLGITAKITGYKGKYYNINFYNKDLYEQQLSLPLAHTANKTAYEKFLKTIPSKESLDKLNRNDLVPFGPIIFERVKKLLPGATRKKDRDPEQFCIYNTMKQGLKTGCVTRAMANKIINIADAQSPEAIPEFWRSIVADKAVSWTYATKVLKTSKRETMYDITVPGPYTFTTLDGLVIQDTLGVHVPVTAAAVAEAKNFMPTKVLDDPRDYGVTLKPSHDVQLGLFALTTKGDKKLDNKFNSLKEAEQAFLRNDINLTDVVTINGYETTFGREKLRSVLPNGVAIPENGIDKSKLDSFFREVADKDKANVNKYFAEITKLATEYNLYSGIGLTLKDLMPSTDLMTPVRKKLKEEFTRIDNLSDRTKFLTNVISDFNTKGKAWVKENVWKNNLATMSVAAGKPGFDSVKQLVFAPLAVTDEEGKLIPIPITRNYSQGVTASDFWIGASGARKGMLDRQLQTAEPGYFAKQMISVAIDQVISENDCGTKNTIELPIANKRDIIWRYDSNNNLIDNAAYENLLRSGAKTIKVRSPITCEANEGVCQKCYGHNPNGNPVEIGANVGTEAGQVATERTTQLTMKTFHCLHRSTLVLVRLNNIKKLTTFKRLWEETASETVYNTADSQEEKLTDNLLVFDNGVWTKVHKLIRHKRDTNSAVVMTRSEDNNFIVSQDNHPNMVIVNGEAPTEITPAELDLTQENTFVCTFPIWSENKITPEIDPYFAGIFASEGGFAGHMTNGNFVPNGIVISQNTDSEIYDFCVKAMSDLQSPNNLKITYRRRGASENALIKRYGRDIGDKFSRLFGIGSADIGLPEEFVSYSDEHLKSLLCGVIDGDGCVLQSVSGLKDVRGAISIELSSLVLVQQLVLICKKFDLSIKVNVCSVRPLTRNQTYKLMIYPKLGDEHVFAYSVKLKNKPITFMKSNRKAKLSNSINYVKPVFFNDDTDYVYDMTTESHTLTANGVWTHNTGSVATTGPSLASGFDRLKQLAHFPDYIKDRATLAHSDGKITDIKPNPAGGLNIFVGDEKHFCPVSEAKVSIGDTVTKGQPLTSGAIKPQELLSTKGIRATQDYLIDEMQKTFTDQGVDLNRRSFETIVRSTTNVTKIIDPADSDFLAGDKIQLTKVLAYNKMNPGKPIKHEPELLGVDFSSKITDDWMAKLNTNRIKTVLQDAVAAGNKSYTHSYNPVAPYVIGSEFGKGEKGKY